MRRYMKYALQSELILEDDFCRYLVQDRFCWNRQVLDASYVIFHDEEDAEAMLRSCVAHNQSSIHHPKAAPLSGP
ncbi:MAG: hypothetical protein HKP58_08275 [Desulfatitalea sp.]|nr:hypothetical protein [Desulfatitalea sp.]NNK00397.1 hypothetical protein [Desulfatitalea sp.]